MEVVVCGGCEQRSVPKGEKHNIILLENLVTVPAAFVEDACAVFALTQSVWRCEILPCQSCVQLGGGWLLALEAVNARAILGQNACGMCAVHARTYWSGFVGGLWLFWGFDIPSGAFFANKLAAEVDTVHRWHLDGYGHVH